MCLSGWSGALTRTYSSSRNYSVHEIHCWRFILALSSSMVWITTLNASVYFHLSLTLGFWGKPRRMSINNHQLENQSEDGDEDLTANTQIKSRSPLHLHYRDTNKTVLLSFPTITASIHSHKGNTHAGAPVMSESTCVQCL